MWDKIRQGDCYARHKEGRKGTRKRLTARDRIVSNSHDDAFGIAKLVAGSRPPKLGGIAKVLKGRNNIRMLRANVGVTRSCQSVSKCFCRIRATKVERTCQRKFIPQPLQPNSCLVLLLRP